MSMSNFMENKVLNHISNLEAYVAPENMFLALLTTSSNEDEAGTEVVSDSYSRQTITFEKATEGVLKNKADITYDVASEEWGTIISVAVFDAKTEGNMLFYADLEHPQAVGIDNQVVFKVGKLSITLD